MNETAFSTCAYCPRLCRHVCPVAVGTAWESATPTAMMTAAWRVLVGLDDRSVGLAATNLCLGCGACEAHCKHHIAVPGLLRAFRGEAAPPQLPAPVAVRGELVWRSCGAGAHPSPDQLACCGRRDRFAEREPEGARAVAEENVRLLGGRAAVCDDAECAAWLRAHGANIRGPDDA